MFFSGDLDEDEFGVLLPVSDRVSVVMALALRSD
jgi:hypothetical protein